MRYFVVEYYQRPDGKYDEKAMLEERIKPKTLQRAMVILDYQDRKIVKLRADLAAGPRDFDRISTFFKNNRYGEVIGKLEEKYQLLDAAVAAVQSTAKKEVEENTD
jgi:hypothetical protein